MLLWWEKILEIISVLLNLLSLVLCLNIWSIPENVLCAIEKVMCILIFFFFGCSVPKISIENDKNVLFYHLGSSLPYSFFCFRRYIHWYKWGVKASYYYCITINLTLWHIYFEKKIKTPLIIFLSCNIQNERFKQNYMNKSRLKNA